MDTKSPGSPTLALINIWVAVIIWSASFLAARALVEEFPPETLLLIRFVISGVLLAGFVYVRDRAWPRLPAGTFLPIFTFGLIMCTLGYGVEFEGLKRTSAGDASIIIGLVPLFQVLLGAWYGEEHIRAIQWIGTAIAALGSVWLVKAGQPLGLSDPLGDAMLLVAAIANAYANLLVKRKHLEGVDPLVQLAYAFALGGICLAPFAVAEIAGVERALHVGTGALLSFLYLTILSTVVAYVCYFYGLRRTSLVNASLPLYLLGPFTVLLAGVALGEAVTFQRVAACAAVTAGVVMAGISGLSPGGRIEG